MKAAIYSRFSTDRQTESSIADQVRVCTEHAKAQGWRIVAKFEDLGDFRRDDGPPGRATFAARGIRRRVRHLACNRPHATVPFDGET